MYVLKIAITCVTFLKKVVLSANKYKADRFIPESKIVSLKWKVYKSA